jgi:argininosuccinate synthase
MGRTAPDPGAEGQARRKPLLDRRELLHTSSEGKVLEDPWEEVPDYVYSRTVNPEDAPDAPEYITIDFERGDGVALNGRRCRPRPCSRRSTTLGRKHGIGRLDLVENRFVGMKSRGMYETPGGDHLSSRASRHRADHAGSRRGAPERRTDAPLCRADL